MPPDSLALGLPVRTRQRLTGRRCRLSAGYEPSAPVGALWAFWGVSGRGGRGAEVGAWWPRNASLEN